MIAAFARVLHRHRSRNDSGQYLRAREAEAMCDHVWIRATRLRDRRTEPEPVNPEPVEAEVGQPQPELLEWRRDRLARIERRYHGREYARNRR